tara:strand:- start:547 stop:1572 length:1026 start_codon:yes stop_codon:yes gene_type:complete
MNSPDLVTRLHGKGISAHEFRFSFVDQTVGITVMSQKQPNPFISLRKNEIKNAYKRTPEDYEDTLFEAEDALHALEDAERPAKEALIEGQYIGLGYTSPAVRTLIPVPQQHWHFLSIDFDEGSATGPDLQYEGLRFVESEKLDTEDKQVLQKLLAKLDTAEPDTQDSEPFEGLGAKLWNDITLRFLKNEFVEVGGPSKKIKVSMDQLGLMNKTEAKPNVVFELLLKMEKDRKVSIEQKHQVSRLRGTLEAKFNLPGDPFQLEEQRGYVPNFKIIDDRNDADERAKSEATHVSHDDNIDYEGEVKDLESSDDSDDSVNQDDLNKDYDDEDDQAGRYLREHDR